MGGHRALHSSLRERGWLMERDRGRVSEVTVRGLMGDDGTRRTRRCRQLWHGLEFSSIAREMSFKKSVLPAEQDRSRRGAPPGALEKISDED